jgi:hypothetical protein
MKLNNDVTLREANIDGFQKIRIESVLQHSNTQANLVEMFKQMKIYLLGKIEKESLSEWGRMIWV